MNLAAIIASLTPAGQQRRAAAAAAQREQQAERDSARQALLQAEQLTRHEEDQQRARTPVPAATRHYPDNDDLSALQAVTADRMAKTARRVFSRSK